MSDLTIPEEAIERACVAMNDGVWTAHHRERWGPQVELILGAAAPLIVAANTTGLKDSAVKLTLLAQAIRGEAMLSARPGQLARLEEMADEIEQVAGDLRASVLRGEGATDA